MTLSPPPPPPFPSIIVYTLSTLPIPYRIPNQMFFYLDNGTTSSTYFHDNKVATYSKVLLSLGR